MHRYLIKYEPIDSRQLPAEHRLDADTFERDGNLIVFIHGSEPVFAVQVDRVITIERLG